MDTPEKLEVVGQSKSKSSWSLKDTVQGALDTAAGFATGATNSAKDLASQVTSSASDAASSAKDLAVKATNSVSAAVGKTADLVGDLNGDGKFDEEDLKIAIAKGKEVVAAVANEAGSLAKDVARDVAKSELVKDAAAGAVVGAALFSVLPIVGTATGAVVGGAAVAAKKLLSK